MLRFVAPRELSDEQIALLCAGAAPGGFSDLDVVQHLMRGDWMPFSYAGVMVACEKQGDRLYIRSLAGRSYYKVMQQLRDAMRRLAADWQCHTVETTCFDSRMAKAMIRLEAEVESWTLIWQV